MSFSCPPSEFVSYTLEKLSFSGQFGLTLVELWNKVGNKLQSTEVDSFQKQIIWQWLFFSQEDTTQIQLYITKNGSAIPILPNYNDLINASGPEEDLRVLPTSDTQWKYLTGSEPTKRVRAQLGEKPFQLLCEIAKHGSSGILSPDLCKATGQDPRSLPSRFKRLVEMGFIVRKSVYHEKSRQHTNLCIHTKFSDEKNQGTADEYQSSRSTHNLRQLIVQSVRKAPNNLRGFNDLKRELKLDKSKSSGKFFGAIVEALHKGGFVEKLMVKGPGDEHLVYSIKFIKDLPKNLINNSDYVELFTSLDDLGEEDQPSEKDNDDEIPLYNIFYPIANQIHRQISLTKGAGSTSKALIRNLSGVSSYRPWTRMLDSMTSYAVDDNTLVPLKSCPDKYDSSCLVKVYDYEGKFKFYRYFLKDYYTSLSQKESRSKRKTPSKILNKSLKQLNTAHAKVLGKTPRGDLLDAKKRTIEEEPLSCKVKKPKLESNAKVRTKRSASKKSSIEPMNIDEDINKESSDNHICAEETGSRSVRTLTNDDSPQPILIEDMKPILPPVKPIVRARKSAAKVAPISSSLKGRRRRAELLAIVRDMGGVTYTTAKLRRILDQRLGNSTVTDIKTLARDISILISTNDLEVQNITFTRTGQKVTRRLLILTDVNSRPTSEMIEKVREECLKDIGEKNTQPVVKRVIESEVTLFQTSKPKAKTTAKGRLGSLGDESNTSGTRRRKRTIRKSGNQVTELEEDAKIKFETEGSADSLPALVSKKHRRKAKPSKRTNEKGSAGPPRRFRYNYKFDKADATTLFRAVIISKSFTRSSIDFSKIADLFEGMDSKSIKQKWTVVRKSVGGLQAVIKGIEAFEHIVMKGIEDELVSAEDLENVKFPFFLDLWRESDNSVLEISDKTPLFNFASTNKKEYNVVETQELQSDLFEQLEDNSMRQKDAILSGITFFINGDLTIRKQDHDDLRTVLKAIFSTSEVNFTGARVKQILEPYGDNATQQASSALIKDKEMIYYGSDDSNSRFVLTDKVFNSLISKLPPKFLNQAANFSEDINWITEARKGLIVSQNILNGQMAPLLHLIAQDYVKLFHVDKFYQFQGYESRLIDKDKLACDIIVVGTSGSQASVVKKVPVPVGKACSHIWLDLNGNINTQLWIKIITSILTYIHFRPGIPSKLLFGKMQTILGVNDYESVMNWLEQSGSIASGSFGGYWTRSNWYSTIGY